MCEAGIRLGELMRERTMRVEIRDEDGRLLWAVWSRWGVAGGMTSTTYRADGTLRRIIETLEGARQQAVGELAVFHEIDGVANIGAASTEVNGDVPVAR